MSLCQFNRTTLASLDDTDPYILKVKRICSDWINGRESFTLKTSGSTGTPKEIHVSRKQLKASVCATKRALSLPSGTKAFVCLNIDYVAGFMMLIRAMELDWEVGLVPAASNPLLTVPEEHTFDFTAMVPMQLSTLLANQKTAASSKKLGKILLGGVGLTYEQREQFSNLPQEVYLGYGMTETVSHVAIQRLSPETSNKQGIYFVTGDVEFGTDARGCLYFEGEVTDNQRVQTNDLATLIPGERAFQLSGRIDNVVNSGGLKIQLEELENSLYTLFRQEGITNDFFLWKTADSLLGEALVLVVEGSSALEDKLVKTINRHVDRLKKPRRLYFAEQFLKTGSQKVDKYRTFEALIKSV
jgi:O-succinylbenzoic acid--CoA ligase